MCSAGDVDVARTEGDGIPSDTADTTGALVDLGSIGAGEGIVDVRSWRGAREGRSYVSLDGGTDARAECLGDASGGLVEVVDGFAATFFIAELADENSSGSSSTESRGAKEFLTVMSDFEIFFFCGMPPIPWKTERG